MAITIISILFLLLYAWLIAFYHRHWTNTPSFQPAPTLKQAFLSIVIAARNEEKNIADLLRSLQQQVYPPDQFEIILVNDFSSDNTAQAANQHAPENLVLLHAPGEASASSKKNAIAFGIQKAKGELIVTTDADCQFHHEWLSSINAFYQDQQSRFIAAPVRFTYQDNWIERLQALDFMILQGITGASVSSRFHDMCNGANLAYTRKSFEKVNGFAGVDHLASGDDMFLMHKVAKLYPDRVHYLKSKEAIVTTRPMTTWKALLQQRRRWASKTFAYTDRKLIATLGFVYVFNLWFLILLAAGFLQPVFFLYALCFILVKTLIEWPFVRSVSQFFGEEKLLRWFPFFQPVHIIYTILVGVLSQWGRYEWKGRTTK